MNKDLAQLIVDASEEGVDITENYSGRGMYGKETAAIKLHPDHTSASPTDLLAKSLHNILVLLQDNHPEAFEEVMDTYASSDEETVSAVMKGLRRGFVVDSLGRGEVMY